MSEGSKDKRELTHEQLEKIAGGKVNPNTSSSTTGATHSGSTYNPPRKHPSHPPVIHHTSSSST